MRTDVPIAYTRPKIHSPVTLAAFPTSRRRNATNAGTESAITASARVKAHHDAPSTFLVEIPHTTAKIGQNDIATTDRVNHTTGRVSRATNRTSPGTDPPS